MKSEGIDFTNARKLRKIAEAKLKEKKNQAERDLMQTDLKKLTHELQVHQIELEMQNEELQKAYEATEIALKKYTMLYDMAPMGYLTIKSDGRICELNFTAADTIGERRFTLVDTNLKLFIKDESKEVFNEFIDKVFKSKIKETCKVRIGKDDTHSVLVYMEGIVVEEEKNCLLAFLEIPLSR